MSRQEHLRLLGELNQLRQILDRIPVANVIDRTSLAARMREVEAALNDSGIILSNDAPSKSENLQLWADEAERRLADLHAGKASEYPAGEVFQSIRAALA